MKRTIAVVSMMLFVASMLAFAAAPPADKKLETKQGAVTFSHSAHEKAGAKCADCHHKGGEDKACNSCHNKESKVKLFDAIHKTTCKECHAKELAAGKKAPKACGDCHKKA